MSTRAETEVKASRRALLLGCVGLALTVGPRRADAQQKAAQKVVQYQEKPKGAQECDKCLHFLPPTGCKLVEGKINPKGWCVLFAPKPK